jgi:uncharacterized protein YkwD
MEVAMSSKITSMKTNLVILYLVLFCICITDCGNGPIESKYSDIEQRVYELANEHRISEGLVTLQWSEIIAEQCRIHSQDMAQGIVDFGHDGFSERIDNIRDEIMVTAAGENVAYNIGEQDPANAAVEAWLSSPGHRANIEGDYNFTGVGVAKTNDDTYYFTQIFIRN